uniref:NOP protein chaperone 1 n=3 Tax=Macaca TaxID=9539 RepID=F7H2Y2_MACMU
MEVHGKPQGSASCLSPTRDSSRVPVSKELLTAGSDGRGGIWDRLLINSQNKSRKTSSLQTVRIERSPLLDQVQTFLPQMARANEKLRKEMAAAPPGRFNIENIDGPHGKVIQMVCWSLLEVHSRPCLPGYQVNSRGCRTAKIAACSFLWKLRPRGAPTRCQLEISSVRRH